MNELNAKVMKIHSFLILCSVLAMTGHGMADPARTDTLITEDSEISWGAETDLNNQYVWRGILFDPGCVLQPDIWISYRGFTCEIWGNAAFGEKDHFLEMNEVDVSLSYAVALWKLEFESSFIYYQYPHQEGSPPTGEWGFSIGYPVRDCTFLFRLAADVVAYTGALYSETAVEYEKALPGNVSLSLALILGAASKKFNESYVGIPKSALNMLAANVSLGYRPAGWLRLEPHMQFYRILDPALAAAMNRYFIVFGLFIGLEF